MSSEKCNAADNNREIIEPEIIENSNLPSTINNNEQNFNTAIKNTEKELQLLKKIFDNIQAIQATHQAIQYQRYLNDLEYKNFITNVENIHNSTLHYAESIGVKIWKTNSGKTIYYRINPFNKKEKINSGDDIRNLLNAHIKIFDVVNDVQIYDNTLILVISLLPMIEKDVFYPYSSDEFFPLNNLNYRNTFQYTHSLNKKNIIGTKSYLQNRKEQLQYQLSMQQNIYYSQYPSFLNTYNAQPSLQYCQQSFQLPLFKSIPEQIHDIEQELFYINNQLEHNESFIENFIQILSQNEYQFNYIMQWLAHFFQTLNNGKVALVLLGDKKTTDTLIEDILKPIFATKDEYFSTINNETLKKSNDSLLKDKIFYHFDNLEASSAKDSKTSELIFEILKTKTSNNLENYIDGGVLVTSSEDTPYPFLKDIYSICSIFKVKHFDTILKKMNIDRIFLNQAIQNDLNNFSNILAQYTLKKEYYHIATTFEKTTLEFMKNGFLKTQDTDIEIENFIDAIRAKKLFYFRNIQKENMDLYQELKENFYENMIAQPMLSEYFNIVYGDKMFPDNSSLLNILKDKSEMFAKIPDDKSKYNSKKRYKIF